MRHPCKPIIAIVGKPNVGKSTLFNRLAGRRVAIVHNEPGVTRDCRLIDVDFYGMNLQIMDTPGLLGEDTNHRLSHAMTSHALQQLGQASMIALIVDGRKGLSATDYDLADLIRQFDVPKMVLVNKCEGRAGEETLCDVCSFGIETVLPVSAEYGDGLVDMAHHLKKVFFKKSDEIPETMSQTTEEELQIDENTPAAKRLIHLTIVGRPNVGKSTLVNQLLGHAAQLVADMPGVTRDAVAYPFSYADQDFELIDTAGLRRRSNVTDVLEHLSANSTDHAIRFGDVVVLLIDGTTSLETLIEKQDLTLARYIAEEGRAIVLGINKVDEVKNQDQLKSHLMECIQWNLSQLSGIRPILMSAQEGSGVDQLMREVVRTYALWNKRIGTHQLNQWFQNLVDHYPPPISGGRRIRLKYITQIKTRPPTFMVFCTNAAEVPDNYQRYIVNNLRKDFGFDGVPIRLTFKSPKNPYGISK